MRSFVLGALLAFGATVAPAATVVYTDRAAFLAAITGAVTNDFEENGPGTFTNYPTGYDGGLYLITSLTGVFTVDPDFDGFYNWGTGDVLDLETGDTTITLSPALRAFGFDFGNPTGLPGSGLITINGDDYAQLGQPTFNFFGIVSDGAIGPISINWNGGLGIMDNVVFSRIGAAELPTPGTLALLGLGLLAAAARRRRAA